MNLALSTVRKPKLSTTARMLLTVLAVAFASGCGPPPETSQERPMTPQSQQEAALKHVEDGWVLNDAAIAEEVHGDLYVKITQNAESEVLQHLKAPATAKFTHVLVARMTNGSYACCGYVDSQNSYAAMLRERYCVCLDPSSPGQMGKIAFCAIGRRMVVPNISVDY